MKDYYIVAPDGPTAAIIREFIQARKAAYEARYEIEEEYGADGRYESTAALAGLRFEHENPPTGFHHLKKDPEGIYRPDARTKAGKAIQDRFDSMRMPGAFEFNTKLGADIIYTGARTARGTPITFVGFETFGDVVVLKVPRNSDDKPGWVPPSDCQQMKQSEYWALKEAKEKGGK